MRRNIMLLPKAEKEVVYDAIHLRWQNGERVTVKEHQSGFPAMTIDCADIHVITDILSLEEWERAKRADTAGADAAMTLPEPSLWALPQAN